MSNFELPSFLFVHEIGIILYFIFLDIIFKGNSKKTLKLSDTNGKVFQKCIFSIDFECICKIIIIA